MSRRKLYSAFGSIATSMTAGLLHFNAALTASPISEERSTLKPLAQYSSAILSNGGLLISDPI